MEQTKHANKVRFVFVWGVLRQGLLTAVAITLFDSHTTRRIETIHRVVGRLVTFMLLGIFFGRSPWNRVVAHSCRKPTKAGHKLWLVPFVGSTTGRVCPLRVTTCH
jgi:hypothetical protein